MSQAQLEIIAIAAVVAAGCALVGSFLVLRRMSLMSDAISHSVLPGIVLVFFLVHETATLPLLLGATLSGLVAVTLVEALHRTRLVNEDSAIGLVFPILFSIGVILISRFAGNVHLDTDAVLLGELALAPFDRLALAGWDIGPRALWVSGAVALLDLLFVLLFYKELKLSTFDAGLAAALGFSPALLHYALMLMVALTAVASFEAAGSVLVVALMIAPPAAAWMLTDRLRWMIGGALLIGVASAVGGYFAARLADASIAGSMATMTGAAFLLALLLSPARGLLPVLARRRRQRLQFAGEMLLVHLSQHEGQADEAVECSLDHLHEHLRWKPPFAARIVRLVTRRELARVEGNRLLLLTEAGRRTAREVVER